MTLEHFIDIHIRGSVPRMRLDDILDPNFTQKYDYVFANGIFYLLDTDAEILMKKLIITGHYKR